MDTLRPATFLMLLLSLGFLACFVELGRMDVVWANEGQRAAPPAEMLRANDWVMPTLNGKNYLAKPPLLYWTIATLYATTGNVSEWIARVPTALCMIGLLLALYGFGRKLAGERAARWAALAALATPYLLERARWANLDLPLTLTTFLCLVLLYTAWNSHHSARRYGFAVLAGLALAAATMLKGPVPYLFLAAALLAQILLDSPIGAPVRRHVLGWSFACFALACLLYPLHLGFPVALVALLGGWVFLTCRAQGWKSLQPLFPALVTLAVAMLLTAPWAILVLERLGWDNISTLLKGEVVDRTHTATDINSGTPFYFYFGLVAMVAPLSLLLPLQFSGTSWRENNRAYRWCVATGWLSVLIFSLIAGKEYEYILPGVPLLLLALGVNLDRAVKGGLEGWRDTWFRLWQKIMRPVLGIAVVLLVGYAGYSLPEPELLTELSIIAVVVLLVLWIPARREFLPVAARIAIASTCIIVGGLVYRSFGYTGDNSPKTIASLCADLIDAGHAVEATKIYPQFTYYAAHPIRETLDEEVVVRKLQDGPPYYYLTRKEFVKAFHGDTMPGSVIVMGPVSDKELILLTNPAGKAVADQMIR